MSKQKKILSKKSKAGIALGCILPVAAATGAVVAVTIVDGDLVKPEQKTVDSDQNDVAKFTFDFKEQPGNGGKVNVSIDVLDGIPTKFVNENDEFVVVDRKLEISFTEDKLYTISGSTHFSLHFEYVNEGGVSRTLDVNKLTINWAQMSHTIELEGSLDTQYDCQANYSGSASHELKVKLDDEYVTDDPSVEFVVLGDAQEYISINKEEIKWGQHAAGTIPFQVCANVDGHPTEPISSSVVYHGVGIKGGKTEISVADSIKGFDDSAPWQLILDPEANGDIPVSELTYRVDVFPATLTDVEVNEDTGYLSWYKNTGDHKIEKGQYKVTVHAQTIASDPTYQADSQEITINIGEATYDGIEQLNIQNGRSGSVQDKIGKILIDGTPYEGATFSADEEAQALGITINSDGTYSWDSEVKYGTFTLKVHMGMYYVEQEIEVVPHNISVVGGPSDHKLDWGLDYNNTEKNTYQLFDGVQQLSNVTFSEDTTSLGFKFNQGVMSWDEGDISIQAGESKTFKVKGVSGDGLFSDTTDDITISRQTVEGLTGNFNINSPVGAGSESTPVKIKLKESGEFVGDYYEVSGDNKIHISNTGLISWDEDISVGEHTFSVTVKKGLYTFTKADAKLNIIEAKLTGPDAIIAQAGVSGTVPSSEGNLFKFKVGNDFVKPDDYTIKSNDPSYDVKGLSIDCETGLASWDTTLKETEFDHPVNLIVTASREIDDKKYIAELELPLAVVNPKIEGNTDISLTDGQTNLNQTYKILVNGYEQVCEPDIKTGDMPSYLDLQAVGSDKKSYALVTKKPIDKNDFGSKIIIRLKITFGAYIGMEQVIEVPITWLNSSIVGGNKNLYGQTGVKGDSGETPYQLQIGDTEVPVTDATYELTNKPNNVSINNAGLITWNNEIATKVDQDMTLTITQKSTGYVASETIHLSIDKFDMTMEAASHEIITNKGAGSYEGVGATFNDGPIPTLGEGDSVTYEVDKETLSEDNKNEIYFDNGTNKLVWTEDAVTEEKFTIKVTYHVAGKFDYVASIDDVKLTINEVLIVEEDGKTEFDGDYNALFGKFHFKVGETTKDNVTWSVDDTQNFEVIENTEDNCRSVKAKTSLEPKAYGLTISATDGDASASYTITINIHALTVSPIKIVADNTESVQYQCEAKFDGSAKATGVTWSLERQSVEGIGIDSTTGKINISANATIHTDSTHTVKVFAQYTSEQGITYNASVTCDINVDKANVSGGATSIELDDDGNFTDESAWTLKLGSTYKIDVDEFDLVDVSDSLEGKISIEDGIVSIEGGEAGSFKVKASNTELGIEAISATVNVTNVAVYDIVNIPDVLYATKGYRGGLIDHPYVTKNGTQLDLSVNVEWSKVEGPDGVNIRTETGAVYTNMCHMTWSTDNLEPGNYDVTLQAVVEGVSAPIQKTVVLSVVGPQGIVKINEEDTTWTLATDHKIGFEFSPGTDKNIEFSSIEIDESLKGLGFSVSVNIEEGATEGEINVHHNGGSIGGVDQTGTITAIFNYLGSYITYTIKITILH